MIRSRVLAGFLLTLAASCLAQEHQHGKAEKLGEVHFATSCDEAAQEEFNRAVALRQVVGPEGALAEVNALAGNLENYHLFHAIRGELLLELSKYEQARASALRALELTHNPAEQSLLARRVLEW